VHNSSEPRVPFLFFFRFVSSFLLFFSFFSFFLCFLFLFLFFFFFFSFLRQAPTHLLTPCTTQASHGSLFFSFFVLFLLFFFSFLSFLSFFVFFFFLCFFVGGGCHHGERNERRGCFAPLYSRFAKGRKDGSVGVFCRENRVWRKATKGDRAEV
jgi:hypothetical protein